jgi:endoglucanase
MIRGISWFGFETEYRGLMCDWQHPVSWHLDKMMELDFNYIRLPFSLDYIETNDFSKMDLFFDEAQDRNISVLLDFHRLEDTHQSSAPYNENYNFETFLNGWDKILERYENKSVLRSVDIFNEYQTSNFVEWNSLARQIVSFIEDRYPGRFTYYVGGVNWGGNLHDMDLSDLPFFDRIVYTIHKYWFSDQPPRNDKWDYSIKKPVMVGEYGYKSGDQHEVDFAYEFMWYMKENDIRDTFFWTWSPNSGDTGGILLDDCTSVDYKKINYLRELWNL